MSKTWEAAGGTSGQPDALDLLLYETDDRIDDVFSDPELVDELARSFYAMDNYVAEVEFIADALFRHPEAVEVMAERLTALRELMLRDMSRSKLFGSAGAVAVMGQSQAAMEYLATTSEFGERIQRNWIADALDIAESREEFIATSQIAFQALSESSVAMDEIKERTSVMQDTLPTSPDSVDIFFQSEYQVGNALSTHNPRLVGTPVEDHNTFGEILADASAVQAVVNEIDTTLELIRGSEDVALDAFLSGDVSTDVATDDVPTTEFLMGGPDVRTRSLASLNVTESVWYKTTSSVVWEQFAGSYPATQNGVGIEGSFSIAEGRLSPDSTSLEVAWTSDGDADSFTGLGININADLVDTFTLNTRVDTEASGTLTVEVEGDRAFELLDTDHATGWDGTDIDISTYSGEITIMLGVTQQTTADLAEGVFRFGDFRFN